MLSLHKKKRMFVFVVVAMAVLLPVAVFAINKVVRDAQALDYDYEVTFVDSYFGTSETRGCFVSGSAILQCYVTAPSPVRSGYTLKWVATDGSDLSYDGGAEVPIGEGSFEGAGVEQYNAVWEEDTSGGTQGDIQPEPRVLTVSDASWSPGTCGEENTTHSFTLSGEHQLYTAIEGSCTKQSYGDDRAIYVVKLTGLNAGDVITFDWDARDKTSIIIVGDILILEDIYSIGGTELKAYDTDGPGSISYTATQDNDGLILTMKYGRKNTTDRSYVWLDNVKVNGLPAVLLADTPDSGDDTDSDTDSETGGDEAENENSGERISVPNTGENTRVEEANSPVVFYVVPIAVAVLVIGWQFRRGTRAHRKFD